MIDTCNALSQLIEAWQYSASNGNGMALNSSFHARGTFPVPSATFMLEMGSRQISRCDPSMHPDTGTSGVLLLSAY